MSNALLDSMGRRNNRKHPDKECPHCGTTFRPRHGNSRYCSRPCMWANNGKYQDRTGSCWVNQKGYMEAAVWEGDKRVSYKLHRKIMESHLGRALFPHEDVHHINGDKLDNRLCNLEIIDHGAHTKHHNVNRKYKTGYRLNISDEERNRRSMQAKRVKPWVSGLPKAIAALAKARGEKQ